MPANNTIFQRIAIEGAVDVIKALKDMGAAGDAAIKQIKDAIDASSSTTSALGSITDKIREGFRSIREHIEPIKGKFNELRESAGEFKNKISEVAESVFPHFREVAALATAGAVAGFVELVKGTADFAQELKRTADEMGVNVQQYQQLQFVMRSVGLDQERFVSTFTRLARSVGQAIEEQRQKLLDYTQKLFGDSQTNGVKIVGETEKRLQEQATRIRSVVGTNSKEVIAAATQMYQALREAAQKTGAQFTLSFEQVKQRVQEIATDPTLEGAKDRINIFKNLGVALPAQRVSEEIERIKHAGKDLDRVFRDLGVPLKDVSGNTRNLIDIMEGAAKGLNRLQEGEKQFNAQLIFNRGFKEVLPLFSHGGEEIRKLREEYNHLNVAISDTEIEMGSKLFGTIAKLNISLENLKSRLILVFSPEIVEILDALVDRINKNAGAVVNWARGIREELEPGLKEIVGLIKGDLATADVKVDWVNHLIVGFQFLRNVIIGFIAIVRGAAAALDPLAEIINDMFGSKFTGGELLAIAYLAQITGGFGLLLSAISLVKTAFSVLLAVISEGLIPVLAAFGPVGWVAAGLILIGSLALTLTGSWDKFFKYWGDMWQTFKGTLQGAYDILKGIVGLLGQTAGAEAKGGVLGTAPVGFSGGGQVPGSGSGDRIPARLESEEFVVQKAVVRQPGMLDFLHGLNRGLVRAFAGGGLAGMNINPSPLRISSAGATGGGSRSSGLTLVIEGKAFGGLSGPSQTIGEIEQHARTSSMTRASRAPSWKGAA